MHFFKAEKKKKVAIFSKFNPQHCTQESLIFTYVDLKRLVRTGTVILVKQKFLKTKQTKIFLNKK
jgi:hypothetical protein